MRNNARGTEGDREAQLPQDAAHGVDARGACPDPSGAQTMESGESVLLDGLDGYGADVFVAVCFE